MCEAAQPKRDNVTDGDYWYTQARKGLAPYLHAASLGEKTMADVVRWIDTQAVDDVETILREHAGVEAHLEKLMVTTEARQLRRKFQRTIEDQITAQYQAEHDLMDGSNPWVTLDPKQWPIDRQRELKERIGEQLLAEV